MEGSAVANPREVPRTADIGAQQHMFSGIGLRANEGDEVPQGGHVTVVHGSPLDYSFQDIRELDDLSKYEPSGGVPLKRSTASDGSASAAVHSDGVAGNGDGKSRISQTSGAKSLFQAAESATIEFDDSAHIITAVSHADEQAAAQAKREANRYKMHVRTITTGLRLSNNSLVSLGGLLPALTPVMAMPTQNLMWLDVSFNDLTKIGDDLAAFPHLKVLYFHGNKLSHLGSVRKLAALQYLSKVTFHGNPIEHKKNYRSYVVEALPTIKSLDFTPITRNDRAMASTWHATFYKGKKPSSE